MILQKNRPANLLHSFFFSKWAWWMALSLLRMFSPKYRIWSIVLITYHNPLIIDIDECVEARDYCNKETEVCINERGGYRCVPFNELPLTSTTVAPNPLTTTTTSPLSTNRPSPRTPSCPRGYVFSDDSRRCIGNSWKDKFKRNLDYNLIFELLQMSTSAPTTRILVEAISNARTLWAATSAAALSAIALTQPPNSAKVCAPFF